MSLLATENLCIRVGRRSLVEGLQWRIEAGQCWCVLGNNGAGKTRLLETLIGLHAPSDGEILLEARPLADWGPRARAQRVGLMPQHEEDPFPLTVEEAVRQGAYPWQSGLPGWHAEPGEIRRRIERALAQTALQDLRLRTLQTLSGGERRRVSAATLLVQAPRILLLDEPTNHLDLRHRLRLLAPFLSLLADGHAVVLVTHELNLAEQAASHLLLLHGNGEWELGPRDSLLQPAPLRRLFGPAVDFCRNRAGERIWYYRESPAPLRPSRCRDGSRTT